MSATESPGWFIGTVQARRAVLFRLSKAGLAIMTVLTGASVVVLTIMQSTGLLAFLAVLCTVAYVLLRVSPDTRSKGALWHVMNRLRVRRARTQGWLGFTRSEVLPVPRPVGHVRIVGVSQQAGDPEQAVVVHRPLGRIGAYFSSTLEIDGRGDGQFTTAQRLAEVAAVEGLLTTLAQNLSPIDDLQITTRALPGLARGYRESLAANTNPRLVGTPLGENLADLADVSASVSDEYRTYLTVSMPYEQVAQAAARQGRVSRDSMLATVYREIGRLVPLLESAGFRVRAGLGPRRLAALIRHLYAPSWGIDDLTGLEDGTDGFVEYPTSPHGDCFVVPDPASDVSWYHASMMLPAYGWPPVITAPRWMKPLVCDVVSSDEPSVIRTITTQYRLIDRRDARHRTITGIAGDEAEAQSSAGRVTGGEWHRQATVGQMHLADFLDGAAGVRVSARATVSAPSHVGLMVGRELVESSASGMGIDGIDWADGRHADAHLWGLPLGRGIRRDTLTGLSGQLGN
ncbi:SCO6880 family protein [Enemella sp. A6]|uniref:SCO6880 family protein n=1 Tax=Enemella sp. A6 TaxID=3440152 RepID=UPI003EBAB4C6